MSVVTLDSELSNKLNDMSSSNKPLRPISAQKMTIQINQHDDKGLGSRMSKNIKSMSKLINVKPRVGSVTLATHELHSDHQGSEIGI